VSVVVRDNGIGMSPELIARVFVVHDNADAADMLAMLIDGLGYQASVETHPRRALERITHEHPDVCLLDVGMPDIDGHALARAIRAAMAEAPILVAITGYSQPQNRSAALEAGFTEHFATTTASHQSPLRHRQCTLITRDDVVKHAHIHHCQRSSKSLREYLVGPARLTPPTRMVVV
jgi:CheY-like chemotaxis protein